MRDVLVQRKQTRPLGGIAKKPNDMDDDDWEELDALTMSTIRLHLADSVYFTVLDSQNSEELWKKLCNTYEKETAANKVYLMRKLYDLRMKDTDSIASHLNQFDALWSQLQAQKMNMDDELKAVFLLRALPSSWDTFCTAISASAPNGKLVYNDISVLKSGRPPVRKKDHLTFCCWRILRMEDRKQHNMHREKERERHKEV